MVIYRAILIVLVTVLAACQPQKFNAVDVTGSSIGGFFSLTDHTGATRTLRDFSGKVVVLFFGFMHCPDVCPTTLSDMAEVKKKLGKDGERLQVLFVTLDPERDTQALLAQYVPAFDPSFIGLYGSPEATAEVAKNFKIFYQKVPGTTATFVHAGSHRGQLRVRQGRPDPALRSLWNGSRPYRGRPQETPVRSSRGAAGEGPRGLSMRTIAE